MIMGNFDYISSIFLPPGSNHAGLLVIVDSMDRWIRIITDLLKGKSSTLGDVHNYLKFFEFGTLEPYVVLLCSVPLGKNFL